jgi:hypothetical protein
MEYYAGLDVALRSCALCIVDSKGTVLFERELVLSRLRSGLSTHLCGLSLECQGAFAA